MNMVRLCKVENQDTENVTWFVLKTPGSISLSQADAFGKIYPSDARPIQPLYGRTVLVSK
jgi:carbonic anhydrase